MSGGGSAYPGAGTSSPLAAGNVAPSPVAAPMPTASSVLPKIPWLLQPRARRNTGALLPLRCCEQDRAWAALRPALLDSQRGQRGQPALLDLQRGQPCGLRCMIRSEVPAGRARACTLTVLLRLLLHRLLIAKA